MSTNALKVPHYRSLLFKVAREACNLDVTELKARMDESMDL